MKRYASLFLMVLLGVAMAQDIRAAGAIGASQELAVQDGQIAVTAVHGAYASTLKEYLRSIYARCIEYRELCCLGVAFVCAYAAYTLRSRHTHAEIACDFDDDLEQYTKGHEAQA